MVSEEWRQLFQEFIDFERGDEIRVVTGSGDLAQGNTWSQPNANVKKPFRNGELMA